MKLLHSSGSSKKLPNVSVDRGSSFETRTIVFFPFSPSLSNKDARSRRTKSFEYPGVERKKITLKIGSFDGRISLYSRGGPRTVRANTANNNFSQISRGIVRPPLSNSSLVESFSFRGKESGGFARFFPSSSLATSFPRVQVAPPPPLCSSRLKARRAEQILSRALRKKTNRWHPSAFKLVPKNLPTLHTFPPPPEINLDNKKRSPLSKCSHSEREFQ